MCCVRCLASFSSFSLMAKRPRVFTAPCFYDAFAIFRFMNDAPELVSTLSITLWKLFNFRSYPVCPMLITQKSALEKKCAWMEALSFGHYILFSFFFFFGRLSLNAHPLNTPVFLFFGIQWRKYWVCHALNALCADISWSGDRIIELVSARCV